jgi:hypothetical protein
MSYRRAKSLDRLVGQINAAYPKRDKKSDGWIGDPRHQSTNSDHNPHVRDGNMGIVTAQDITHDPKECLDARQLAEALVASRDSRIKYIISNGQICSSQVQPWKWRTYTGANKHFQHVHISVDARKSLYDDTRDWNIIFTPETRPDATQTPARPLLRRGDRGDDVKALQNALKITADGIFGPGTEAAVRALQAKHGLTVDGIVGPATRARLV